jgi:DNA-binding CsgD family transcriptional regulator
MFVAILDSLSIGIVVCDRAGRVYFANAKVRQRSHAESAFPLSLRGQTLHTATPDETRAIMRLIRDAATGARGGAIGLFGPDGQGPIPVLVTPLTGTRGRAGLVLLAIGETGSHSQISEAMLAKLFRLSRTQSSIAAAIFNGRSPEDIATARGIKISTVRTHLADIFLRTKVKTQRDLIRLIGSLPPLAR